MERERGRRREFYLGLTQRKLKVRMSLERRGWEAPALLDGLRRDLVQRVTGDPERNADMERHDERWQPEPERGTTRNWVAKDQVYQRESHLVRNEHVLDAVVEAAGSLQSSYLPIVVDQNLFSRHHDHAQPRRRRLAQDKCARHSPFCVMNTAAKSPTPLNPIAALDRLGLTPGREVTGYLRNTVGEDFPRGSRWQECAGDGVAIKNTKPPSSGAVYPRESFKDFHFRHGINFEPAQLARTIESKQARRAHGLEGRIIQTAEFFRLRSVLGDYRRNRLDLGQQLISKKLVALHLVPLGEGYRA